MEGLGFDLRNEAVLLSRTEEVIRSSAIEGESLDTEKVRSSIARHLGLDIGGLVPSDRHVDGIVEMALDATGKYFEPLTKKRLFAWHSALFPTSHSGIRKIRAGRWRDDSDGPMQVVSGRIGREKVHFEAPSANHINGEMESFLIWLNAGAEADLVLQAGIAHFWFVTIHPFDDGNGRIARAISDMLLARSEETDQRFYSMSAQIQEERNEYYDILERSQKGDLDITPWLEWFLKCLGRAIDGADTMLAQVLGRARFWEAHAGESFNDRQRKVLNMLLGDFDGKLTSSKWARLCKCSQDTAGRDINDLLARGILQKNPGGGRSTSYSLLLEK